MIHIMRLILIGLCMLAGFKAEAQVFKVAVIDDGIDPELKFKLSQNICKTGHYDFLEESKEVNYSTEGHGSEVINHLIQVASTRKFCVLIYRIGGILDLSKAINMAVENGAGVINMSVFAKTWFRELESAVINAEKKKVLIFTAAGNDKTNLNEFCNIFPQCLKRRNIIVVGATNPENNLEVYSNYGTNVVKFYKFGRTPSGAMGTSFATPRAVGEFIWSLNLDKRKN